MKRKNVTYMLNLLVNQLKKIKIKIKSFLILVTFEIINYIKNKLTGSIDHKAVKFDTSKVYDMIEWVLLQIIIIIIS